MTILLFFSVSQRSFLNFAEVLSQFRRGQAISFYVENLAGRLALEHIELEVGTLLVARHDAMLSEDLLHRLVGQVRVVVLIAEVAEPHMAQGRRSVLRQRQGT